MKTNQIIGRVLIRVLCLSATLAALDLNAQSLQPVAVLDHTIGKDLLGNPTPDGPVPSGLFLALDTADPSNDATCFLDLTTPASASNPGSLIGTVGGVNRLGYSPVNKTLYSAGGDGSWLVRASVDQGQSWSTIDSGWRLAPGARSYANGFATDLSGNLFVAGYAYDKATTPNNQFWIFRRSANQAQSWTTTKFGKGGIDTCLAMSWVPASAQSQASLFAVGRLNWMWTVMRSRDAGLTWKTVDSWGTRNGEAAAFAIAADAAGEIFVGGEGRAKVSDPAKWYVRTSLNGGDTWQDLGIPFLDPSLNSTVVALAVDPAGTLWVQGHQAWSTESEAWALQRWNPQTGWSSSAMFPYVGTGIISRPGGVTVNAIVGIAYATGGYHDTFGWHGTVLELNN
jgi:hypothetical protein